ncbi:hypothetical protein RHMOL_Rhmol04G0176000 [Rhododendron molle]|uniref:Uncharacterized protein n=1 Tax=Rhododendron molle TaxID=49168 RepID=A0ACC0P3Z2_RHOML|nr:hypothetical protein RHMOL_Rhmol04G0176000 [Rhododendron molle]
MQVTRRPKNRILCKLISTRVRTSQLRKGSLSSLGCLTHRSSVNLKCCYLNFQKYYLIRQILFYFC